MKMKHGFERFKDDKGNKKWVHPAEALLRGHIVYTVKFLGCVDVDEPKGTEIVKDAVRKTKFTKQLKKAEGQKVPKVELTISVDGVTVQEPKYKVIQHQYPLHRISYCADDKSDKRIFTFIAKEGDTNEHKCFVFDSEKCAEEITLTIGQAFDLAYKKFMESSSKDMDMKKNYLLMQKKVQQLTQENLQLKARVANLERMIDPALLDDWDKKQKQNFSSHNSSSHVAVNHRPRTEVSQGVLLTQAPALPRPPSAAETRRRLSANQSGCSFGCENNTLTSTPSRPTAAPVVGRKLENLVFEDNFTDQQPQPAQNGTASPATPVLAPPPPVPPRQNSAQRPTAAGGTPQTQGVDEFGSPPFKVANNNTKSGAQDPFGMGTFNPQEIDRQIQSVDRELLDLHTGFSQGLSFGPDDFNLADLDPLNQK